MKWFLKFFDFYLDASVHVSLAVVSLLMMTALTLNISLDFHLSSFIFFGSIGCYNFIKYGIEAEKYIIVANTYHKNIQIFSLICLAFAIYHAHFMNTNTYIGIGILILLTGFYALPLLPKAKNLRSWGGLKIFIVAIVWSGTTVILPVLLEEITLSWDVWIETIQRFLLVLILLIPFEIRDLAYDKIELKTLPQRFGVETTKRLGILLIVLFFLLLFFKDDYTNQELFFKLSLSLMLYLTLMVTKRNQSKYFASFWVESIPILWYYLSAVVMKQLITYL